MYQFPERKYEKIRPLHEECVNAGPLGLVEHVWDPLVGSQLMVGPAGVELDPKCNTNSYENPLATSLRLSQFRYDPRCADEMLAKRAEAEARKKAGTQLGGFRVPITGQTVHTAPLPTSPSRSQADAPPSMAASPASSSAFASPATYQPPSHPPADSASSHAAPQGGDFDIGSVPLNPATLARAAAAAEPPTPNLTDPSIRALALAAVTHHEVGCCPPAAPRPPPRRRGEPSAAKRARAREARLRSKAVEGSERLRRALAARAEVEAEGGQVGEGVWHTHAPPGPLPADSMWTSAENVLASTMAHGQRASRHHEVPIVPAPPGPWPPSVEPPTYTSTAEATSVIAKRSGTAPARTLAAYNKAAAGKVSDVKRPLGVRCLTSDGQVVENATHHGAEHVHCTHAFAHVPGRDDLPPLSRAKWSVTCDAIRSTPSSGACAVRAAVAHQQRGTIHRNGDEIGECAVGVDTASPAWAQPHGPGRYASPWARAPAGGTSSVVPRKVGIAEESIAVAATVGATRAARVALAADAAAAATVSGSSLGTLYRQGGPGGGAGASAGGRSSSPQRTTVEGGRDAGVVFPPIPPQLISITQKKPMANGGMTVVP